jgi:acetyl-CoA carboxylase biotin carboxylase subunit
MIKRLLIANRGEIALRIVRAARELNIETVAVYSDADRAAPHVLAADQSVRLGPAPAAESYLNPTLILEAARTSGADAIHPGYGFLSERSAFARACEDAGLTFVGPPARAIERMGSKIAARKLMQEAGVPVVPGETPAEQTAAAIQAAARRVGFPVLLKPSGGGGGIGMKEVRTEAELADAVTRSTSEAQAAFGDATVYVERLVQRPRHVEIQVFADAHDHVIHLFERECSVQRRHQKAIEESPCPALTPAIRERMGAAAVAAARAAGYRNAGTVEFLLEGEGEDARFYFLEMNTRLQVEHPVTECVAGVDLVRAQLLVASGEPLPWTSTQLSQRGHAIECRIYAEDPAQGFLPQAGRILLYREPKGPGIRVDSGIVEGSEVSVYYDPMLAKLIVWGETRQVTISRAMHALRNFHILGIRTNIAFLLSILGHPRFASGTVDTSFVDTAAAEIRQAMLANGLPPAALVAAAVHTDAVAAIPPTSASPDPFTTLSGWRG